MIQIPLSERHVDSIDITMTAAIRPDVLEKTLKSIKEKVFSSRKLRLIINIDSRGDLKYTQEDCVEVVKRYFDNVIFNTPSFTCPVCQAQKWVWGNVQTPFVLNWEDDWEVLRKIDLDKMLERMWAYPRASMIYFDREDKGVLTHDGYEMIFEYIGANLFWRKSGLLLWSSPALVRSGYIRQALRFINDLEYMDFTSRTKPVQNFFKMWDFLTYVDIQDPGPFVRDLGRPWMQEKGLIGNKQGPIGYQWEETE